MPRPLVLAALLFSLASAAAEPPSKPAVVWASDPINPGETVLVTGAGFGDKPVVEVGRCDDAAGEAGALPAQMQKVDVLQPNDTSLKFRIPPEFKPGIFAYRITGPNGQVTGTLNRPVIWWAQGDAGAAASPGGWIRLFGKNLGGSAGVPPARAAAPTTVLLGSLRLAAEADCYAAKVALPNDLPPGDYQVSLANGCGGARGVAEAVKIAVQPRPAWPAETFNVRDFGAEGTGRDDTEALKAALAKAEEKGGGVVFLPRGRYKVSDALAIPRFTVLRGEKTELSCLCWADFPKPPFALLKGTNSFAIEDLTLYAHNHQHILAGDQGDKADAGNVRLRRVRVRANAYRGHLKEAEVDERFRNSMKWSTGGGDTVRLGGENLEITGCDLYGSGRALYLSRTRGGLVAGNTFYNGRWGWYCISGSDGLIFENNELAGGDLMSTGGGLNCLDGSPFSQNVYLHHNKFRLMHGWDREAMTSDAGGEVYFGKIASASQTEVVLPEAPKWGKRSCQGMAVLVLDGRGAGQCRRLVSYQGANVTLDRAWDVQLDESSVLGITMYQGHYLILDNEFTDTGAMQFYGTSIECIAAQNTGARMQGFRGLGLWYHGYQPSWFCQFLDNRILDGNYYHWDAAEAAFIEVNGAKRPPLEGPLNRASVLRRNQLAGNAHLQVTGLCSDVIVEHNAVADADMGVFVSENCAHVLVRENTFTNVKHELMDEPAIRKAAEERVKQFMGRQEPIVVLDFESLAAGRFADLSGNRLSAVAQGGVKCVPGGVKGQAASFDGTGWLTIEETGVFNVPDVTVAFWAKPAAVSGRRGFVSKRWGGSPAPFIVTQSGAAVSFEATEENGAWTFNFGGPPLLKENTWAHIAAVVKQGAGVTLYVDGSAVAEKKNAARRATTMEPLVIGRDSWGGDPPKGETPGLYKGLLDEFKLWARALSSDEVRAEYETKH